MVFGACLYLTFILESCVLLLFLITVVPLHTYLSCFQLFSLEMLDKVEPPTIPEGYAMSVAFHCLLDLVRGITTMIEGELGEAETVSQTTTETTSLPAQSSEQQDLQSVSDQSEKELGI